MTSTQFAAENRASAPTVLTRPYYARLHDLELAHGWSRGMLAYTAALLLPLLKRDSDMRVLDLGCGTGAMLRWFGSIGCTRVTGVDLSRDALRFCQMGGQRRVTEASALTLPFPSESFDMVFCADVLQHLPRGGDVEALSEAARLLCPGGYLFLRTNSGCGERATEADTYRRYKRADLINRVAEAGFSVERASYANALPAIPMLVKRLLTSRTSHTHQHDHHQHQHAGDPGLARTLRPRALRWIDHALSLVLHAEAFIVGKLGLDMPFGGSLVLLARKEAHA